MVTTHPPHLVTASAGTGKTYHIVSTVWKLVQQGVRLDQIGIITFTELAAAELRQRVAAKLRENGHPDLDKVQGSLISTIHGFALSLIKRHALSLGLASGVQTLDELAATSLRRLSLNEVLADPLERDRIALLKRGLGTWDLDVIESVLTGLVDKAHSLNLPSSGLPVHGARNADTIRAAFGTPGDAAALDQALDAALANAQAKLPFDAPTKKDQEAIAKTRALAPQASKGDRLALAELASNLPEGAKRGDVEPLIAPLRAAAAQWLRFHPQVLEWLIQQSDGAYGLATSIMKRYETHKQQLSCLDFNDQIGVALKLLEQDTGAGPLAAHVVAEMPYLLVDEFQDTSPLQFRLTESLREHGCQVYYVGDLKQAIFGWRDADSRLMGALIEDAEATGVPSDTLDTNYRSHPDLVAFVNDFFEPLFTKQGQALPRVRAEGLHKAKGVPSPNPRLELLIESSRKWYSEPASYLSRVRTLIEQGTEILDRSTGELRPMRWGDIAVLTRNNKPLDEWATELDRFGIPFSREMPGWSGRGEVLGAIGWLRTLANPHDTQALAGVLASDYFGVPPHEFAPLATAGFFYDPARFLDSEAEWDALVAVLDGSTSQSVFASFRAIWARARALMEGKTLSRAVHVALATLEAEERMLCFPDGEQRRANLLKLLELAKSLEGLDGTLLGLRGLSAATLENFLIWLRTVPDGDHDRQPLVSSDDPDAVRLISMHKAKGLEFPVVIIPSLSGSTVSKAPRWAIAWDGHGRALLGPNMLQDSSIRYVPPHPDVGDLPERFGQADADAARRLEELCLLYVAFTRARDYLIVGWRESAMADRQQAILEWTLHGDTLAGHPVTVTRTDTLTPMLPAAPKPVLDLSDDMGEAMEVVPQLWEPPAPVPRPEPPRLRITVRTMPLAGQLVIPPGLDGPELGKAAHLALRLGKLLRDGIPDTELEVRLVRRWADPIPGLAARAVTLVRTMLGTLGAQEIQREVPLVARQGEEAVAYRLDSLVRTTNGWLLLDYKTDEIPQDLLVERYAPQLYAYAQALAPSLGEVPTIGLVALSLGCWLQLEFDPPPA